MATLRQALDGLDNDLADIRKQHGASRFVGSGAAPEVIGAIAAGGTVQRGGGGARAAAPRAGRSAPGFAKALVNIARHQTDGMTPAYESKALAEATDPAGGFLLAPEIADSVLMLIRNRVPVAKMPVTHVQPQSKLYSMSALAGGASASWLNENAAIPASAETFNIAATMVPRPVASLVAISNRLLQDAASDNSLAAGSVEDVVKADVADLMAVTYDAGLISGTGAIVPRGILNTPGTTPLPAGVIGANGSQVSYGLLVSIIGALQQQSMPFTSPGWIFSGRTLTSLMTLTNSIGEPLLASAGLLTINPSGTSGTLLGYPYAVTNAIPNSATYGTANNASTLIFSSDWSELFLGDWQSVAVDSSQEASYTPDGGVTWISLGLSEHANRLQVDALG